MENNIKKIVELEIDLDNIELDDMGVQCVSFVEEPAIEVDFMAFAKELFVDAKAGESEDDFMGRCIPELISEGYDEDQAIAICYGSFEGKESFKFETYNDYPEAAKANAQRALDWAEKEGWGTCGEATGKQRANQLAKGENISEETIARMASFERHRQNSDTPYTEGCGKLMWDAWGGDEGIAWAQRKLKSIRAEMDADTSALSPYIDQLGEPIKKETYIMADEEQKIILDWAAEHGEQITENYTYLNLSESFSDVGDIAKVITGLDILGKMGIKQDEPAEIKYRYTSLSGGAQRGFCRALMGLNKLYSDGDMEALQSRLGTINPKMGEGGRNNYDVFKYKGGVSCQHFWTSVALYKPEGSRKVLMIEQGPAEGDAGKSNNGKTESPTGSVTNNASVSKDFSFSIQNEEKRIVAGALMIPNQFILRRDEKTGEPYYVFFSRNTIKRIQERFNKLGYQNVTDVQHDGQIKTDNILLEQWIIESKEYDKSKFYGFHNLSLGTWFGVYKVNDDETWADIKSGKIKGFSIYGDFISKATAVKNTDETLLSKIIEVLNEIKE